jgi:hypothetical protein
LGEEKERKRKKKRKCIKEGRPDPFVLKPNDVAKWRNFR